MSGRGNSHGCHSPSEAGDVREDAARGGGRTQPAYTAKDFVHTVPRAILDLHKDVYLAADIFFVNHIPFFLTISRNIGFTTVTPLENRGVDSILSTHLGKRRADTVLSAYLEVNELYLQRGFRIHTVSLDGFFGPLQDVIQRFGTRVNLAGEDEHVPEAERGIQVVKERARRIFQGLPFTRIPPLMVTHMVRCSTFYLNYFFPPEGGISDSVSPNTIMTGELLDYDKDCTLPFGAYYKVHFPYEPQNSKLPRKMGAICLGPTGNPEGGYMFMTLVPMEIVTRSSWTGPLPMSKYVIDRVDDLGFDQPESIPFADRRGRRIGDSSAAVVRYNQTKRETEWLYSLKDQCVPEHRDQLFYPSIQEHLRLELFEFQMRDWIHLSKRAILSSVNQFRQQTTARTPAPTLRSRQRRRRQTPRLRLSTRSSPVWQEQSARQEAWEPTPQYQHMQATMQRCLHQGQAPLRAPPNVPHIPNLRPPSKGGNPNSSIIRNTNTRASQQNISTNIQNTDPNVRLTNSVNLDLRLPAQRMTEKDSSDSDSTDEREWTDDDSDSGLRKVKMKG